MGEEGGFSSTRGLQRTGSTRRQARTARCRSTIPRRRTQNRGSRRMVWCFKTLVVSPAQRGGITHMSRYVRKKHIGTGACSDVYKMFDTVAQRVVAVKVLVDRD